MKITNLKGIKIVKAGMLLKVEARKRRDIITATTPHCHAHVCGAIFILFAHRIFSRAFAAHKEVLIRSRLTDQTNKFVLI